MFPRLYRLNSVLLLTAGLCSGETSTIWKPALNSSWQWQLSSPVDQSVDVAIYDVDLFDNEAAVVASLHAAGRRVICYMSAGTFEPWRPDANRFPREVRGLPVSGFEEESWLDIRRMDVLAPIMEARLDLCKAKGFDAVEPDNIDGYQNQSGFSLTAADQLKYNRFLSEAAHTRGLSIGLKNDLSQIQDLLNDFDWALNEQCLEFSECGLLLPFIDAGKAVFHVEYQDNGRVCTVTNAMQFNTLIKKRELDATRTACREYPRSPALGALANGASGEVRPVAPGEIVAIYGRFLGPEKLAAATTDAGGSLPTQLEGIQVLIGGIPAPLLYVQARQVGAIVPYGAEAKGQVDVQVVGSTARSDLLSLAVAAAAPGVFTTTATGRGQAAVLNEDGSLNTATNPARRGSIVVLYATGEGATRPDGVDGRPASVPYPNPKQRVSVMIGDREAPILFAGAAPGFAGLMQVNARVPIDAPAGGGIPVVVQVGTAQSQPGVTMAVTTTP